MINIKLSNNLIATGVDPKTLSIAKKVLTIENPAYHRVVRITGNSWAAERDFKYYKISKDGSAIKMPRGFYGRFKAYLDKNSLPYETEVDFVNERNKESWQWKQVTLRDYQELLMTEAIKHTEGVISASTGSGKTVMACWLARHFGVTTTILVPNTVIQGQFVNEFKKWFGYEVGVINSDSKNIKDVTVSTFQSLSADKELCQQLADKTSMLIIDECHLVVAPGRKEILEMFKPSRLYGMTGSARRSKDDGQTDAIFFYLGPIIAKHKMPMVKPRVEVISTGSKIPIDDYHAMIDAMVEHDNRNVLITGLAMIEAIAGKKVLILCKRVEHCKKIIAKLPEWGDLIYHADGEDKDRNEILMQMRSGEREFKIIVGTQSLLSTGLDIPSLDVLIQAGDLKSDVLVQQSSGRVLRLFEGKESALIYDLFDSDNPILRKQGIERFNFYKSQEWEVDLPWGKK